MIFAIFSVIFDIFGQVTGVSGVPLGSELFEGVFYFLGHAINRLDEVLVLLNGNGLVTTAGKLLQFLVWILYLRVLAHHCLHRLGQ